MLFTLSAPKHEAEVMIMAMKSLVLPALSTERAIRMLQWIESVTLISVSVETKDGTVEVYAKDNSTNQVTHFSFCIGTVMFQMYDRLLQEFTAEKVVNSL